jgi:hypothetical protein
MRKIAQVESQGLVYVPGMGSAILTAKVYRVENNEYVVKAFLNGDLELTEWEYFTDDKADALETARLMCSPKPSPKLG